MTTQTMERKNIHALIDELPDAAIEKMAHYAAFLRYEAEHIPNAETLAAMEEIRAGKGEAITLEEFKAQLDALD